MSLEIPASVPQSPLKETCSPSAMLALAGIGLLAAPGAALAQETGEATRLGGVTVTDTAIEESYTSDTWESDKSTAALLDTPQTVTVIPEELIRDRGARTLTEVLRNTPGISFNAGENGFATGTENFSLRGFDTSGNIYTDNFRDSGSYSREVFNLESIEVVKGAAADNGRGSAGGYVNINTKRPRLDSFIAGDLSLGLDDYRGGERLRGTIDVNQQLGETVAFRLNAAGEDGGVAGRDHADNTMWGIAPSIGVGLGTPIYAVLSYEHVERKGRPDWGVPGASVEGLITYNPLTEGVRRDNFYGLLTDFDDTTSDALLARIEYNVTGNLKLSNQTRWSRVERLSRFTNPTGFTPATLAVTSGTNFYDRVSESIANQTNMATRFETAGLAHTLALGVEFSSEKSDANRMGAAVPAPGSTSLFDPDPGRAGAAPFNVTQTASVDIDTIGFYLYDTIKFSPHFEITGGIRGESYEVSIADSGGGIADNYTASPFTWNGKIGLVYKPVEHGSLYASFGSSALPPGSYLSNSDISRTGDNAFPGFTQGADPVRAHNYEVGIKWGFMDGALNASAAAFITEKRNVPIVGRPTGTTTGPTSLQGYHKQEIKGIELSLAGHITPAWSVFAGALFLESERKISAELAAIQRAANTGDFPGDFANWAIDGDSLAFTPDFSATLWTTYRFDFGLTLGGGVQHTGSSFLGRPDDALRIIPNGRFGKLDGYTLVNALVSYDLTENIDLRLNIDNLFDEDYAISTNWAGSRAALGAPRTYLLSAGFSF